MKIGCVLLASGLAERFGRNKLLEAVQGKTLIERTLDALPLELFSTVVVVTAYDEIQALAESRGLAAVRNHSPQSGVSLTIKLGAMAAADTDACMFCVCDQPYLDKKTLYGLVSDYDGGILALAYREKRGNPVIFPRALYGELAALGPGQSGSDVIRRHRELLRLYPVQNERELRDIDYESDMPG